MEIEHPFTFDLHTQIVYGSKINEQLPEIITQLGIKHPIIVTDKGVREAGLIEGFLSRLKEIRLPYEIFDEVEPNPKDYNVDRGVEQIIKSGCDGIITIGGGSPMDCAKAMAAVATLGGHTREYVGKGKIQQDVPPIIAVPTTAGTGSEVTFGAVITESERKFKFTIKGTSLAPKVALIDPGLTVSMPSDLTAATGMDALTHAIEAYTAKNANFLSDAFALSSIELIWQNLPEAYIQGVNIEARTGMLIGSLMAGIAFVHSDVGAVHCVAEALGGMYDIPHGICNAVMLPTIMKFNLPFCTERYARIATIMGIDWQDTAHGAQLAVEAVSEMARTVGLPKFSSFGVDPKDFEELALNSAENGSNPSNARPMTSKDYGNILSELHGS
jgi:alcohol dehydrogenase